MKKRTREDKKTGRSYKSQGDFLQFESIRGRRVRDCFSSKQRTVANVSWALELTAAQSISRAQKFGTGGHPSKKKRGDPSHFEKKKRRDPLSPGDPLDPLKVE